MAFQDLIGSAASDAGIGDRGRSENVGYELGQLLHVIGQSHLIQGNLRTSCLAGPLFEQALFHALLDARCYLSAPGD